MKSLVWLRSDLRLNDNPALKEACANYSEVHAIYVYSPQQLSEHNESNVKIDFLIQNLIHLENNLSELNIPLTIIESGGFSEDPLLIKNMAVERQINKVLWNNQIDRKSVV